MAGKGEMRWETIVFDPAGGLSGDMFLGCLLALGADRDEVRRRVASLPGLERFRIVAGRVKRRGVVAVRVRVEASRPRGSRDLRAILSMIRRSPLETTVKQAAARVFETLGEAEGRIHGVPAGRVHFHEVGAVDSIVDIVGSVVALSLLGFPRLYHRPLRLGAGTITFSHGTLPLPAPATLEVLAGRSVILSHEQGEMVTPTGAALARALAEELPPELPLRPGAVVYAAGTRDSGGEPGLLRAIACPPPPARAPGRGRVAVLRTAIDDMSAELFGHVQERLFSAGALDVLMSAAAMKKNRPGVLVTVVCEPEAAESLAGVLFAETTTLGVRIAGEERIELERGVSDVPTPYGRIAVKYSVLPGGALKGSPEYESCRRAAEARGVPLRLVMETARAEAARVAAAKTAGVKPAAAKTATRRSAADKSARAKAAGPEPAAGSRPRPADSRRRGRGGKRG